MSKSINLSGVHAKNFVSLIKRSASMDNMIFITVEGQTFESVAYNKNKSALKRVEADLEKMCDNYTNECDGVVRIHFGNASKFIQVLGLVGTDDVEISFEIDDSNYGHKVTVKNNDVVMNIPCADRAAVGFLEIPPLARESIFNSQENLLYSVGIDESEFKYISQLFGLNKESIRVFFTLKDNQVYVSEIESTDDNVRGTVNEIVTESKYDEFDAFDKLYSKRLDINNQEFFNLTAEDRHLGCYNKQYFVWIDSDKTYTIEFHTNKVKFVSTDDETGVTTHVVLTPVRFA